MTNSEVISHPLKEAILAPLQPKKHHDSKPAMDALLYAYMCIFDSVQTDHQTARIQAKGLQANAAAQENLIDQEAQVNFSNFRHSQLFQQKNEKIRHSKVVWGGARVFTEVWYTTKIVTVQAQVKQTVLEKMEAHNEEVSAIRGLMENQISVLRQGAQVGQTNLNSSIDDNQQTTQEGSSLMQMLTQLTNQISRI